jgi:peptidoglycan/xylan/chitin deacetylase (PgdA/CDA1 family)
MTPDPVRARLTTVTAVALMVALASCAGCAQRFEPAREESAPAAAARAEKSSSIPSKSTEQQPAWRTIDRAALVNSLGWGQVSRGNTADRRIALTFDAGSGGQYAPAILDALKARGLHCTFFIAGQFAEANPSIMNRLAAEGHELGNHSYSHPRFTGLSPDEVSAQLEKTEAAVMRSTGISTKPYFRFPYGAGSDPLVRQINGAGYIGVLWTFDTLDSIAETTPETVRARVAQYACPGAIVLMHLGSPQEAMVLPAVIGDLEASGYRMVTLTEVLSR